MTGSNTFQILQYNLHKSKDTVTVPLLADSATRKFQVLAVQESWINPYIQTSYNPASSSFWLAIQERRDTRVAFYISKDIPPTSWSVRYVTPDLAVLSIQVMFQDSERHIKIYNIYNPPPVSTSDSVGPTTLWELRQDLETYPSEHIIILGDLNLHHPSWNSRTRLTQHAYADLLINITDDFGLQLLTPQGLETWSARGTHSTIDLAFATPFLSEAAIRCDIVRELDHHSDHLPIRTEFQLQVVHNEPAPRKAWEKLDEEQLLRVLSADPAFRTTVNLVTEEQIEHRVAQIHTALLKAIDQTVPWSKPCCFSQSFWTPQCTALTLRARQLRRQAPNSNEYRSAVQAKKRAIRTAKTAHFREQMHKATEKPNGIWKLAKWARTKSHLPPPLPQFPDLNTPEGVATTFEEKEQAFRAKFFPPPPEADLSDIEGYVYSPPLPSQSLLTVEEVENAIRRPKPTKALGLTGIPHSVLQKSLKVTAGPITGLFQACISCGYHPLAFKKARTVALRKQGGERDYRKVGSYRPVALLESLGKALERIVADRLSSLAEEHSLLPKFQMGERPKRDTITALDLLIEQIHTVWNSGSQWVATMLCLDITGAYNFASYPRLLHILRRLRIPTWIVGWVESFLQNRFSTIRIASEESELRPVQNGIPQGSPISPILYLFFNEELIRICNGIGLRSSAFGFVDDINILAWGKSTELNCSTLTRVHSQCIDWAKRHGSAFSPSKYELIHLTRHPKRFNLAATIALDGTTVKPSTHVRILGIEIDSKLRWGPHVRKV